MPAPFCDPPRPSMPVPPLVALHARSATHKPPPNTEDNARAFIPLSLPASLRQASVIGTLTPRLLSFNRLPVKPGSGSIIRGDQVPTKPGPKRHERLPDLVLTARARVHRRTGVREVREVLIVRSARLLTETPQASRVAARLEPPMLASRTPVLPSSLLIRESLSDLRGSDLPPEGGFELEDVDVGARGGGAAGVDVLVFGVGAEAVGRCGGGRRLHAQGGAGFTVAGETGG